MKFISFLVFWIATLQLTFAQNLVITAPNTFRLGIKETVAISISNYNNPVEVTLILQDYPGKTHNLASAKATVQKGKPVIIELLLDSRHLSESQKDDPNLFVNLVASASVNSIPKKEVRIPVTRFAGYMFIQTDKPLYLPSQKVYMRIIYLDEKLLPVQNDGFILEITNPRGTRVMYKDMLPDPNGITEASFDFPALPVFGNWSVIVNYGYKFSGKSKVSFEVKDYVLPTFSVDIKSPQFILTSTQIVRGEVHARYVYGKPVDGYANVQFKVKDRQGQITDLGTQRNLLLKDGVVAFNIRVERSIKGKVPWFPQIEGSKLIVEALVFEKATGKSASSVDDTTVFTTSPYILSLESSLKEFKPGVPYRLVVDIRYTNKQIPEQPVQLELMRAFATNPSNVKRELPRRGEIVTNRQGHAVFSLDTQFDDKQLEITIKTKDEALGQGNQAVANIIVKKYDSPIPNTYVWIEEPHEGTLFTVNSLYETKIHINGEGSESINYLVVSKGRILFLNESYTQNAFVQSIQFPITADMVPSFRLIVYIVRDSKIIADALQIHVQKTCKYNNGRELVLEATTNAAVFSPGQEVKLKIRGERMSRVGVVAVDEAVYILNKQDLLSRDKMFNEMKKHDLGHGPGGGMNPAVVFRNAGIQVLSNAYIADHSRQAAIQQQEEKRTKRSIDSKVEEYSGITQVCCRLGRLQGHQKQDCATRAAIIYEAIKDMYNCSEAFLDCCEESLKLQAAHQGLVGRTSLGQMDDDVQGLLDNVEQEVLKNMRHIFPETWFFNTYTIGGDPKCGQDPTVCEVKHSAPHSITTWMVQGVAVSKTNGMCVSNPLKIHVFKPMFIQLYLPVSAIRGEQIEVMATIFNYGDEKLSATVYMYGVEGLCMGAGPGERSEYRKIEIEKNSAVSVTFPVMPLQLGDFPIKVVALSWSSSDAIQKILKVLPEGVPDEKELSLTLDPAGFYNRKKREQPDESVQEDFDENTKKQVIKVDIALPDNHIPGTERCFVSVIGNNMGSSVSTSVSGLDNFVKLPSGCGEQTMIHLAPLVYTMSYLKRTNKITSDIEAKGFEYMWKGYNHELNYRKPDGSFAVWTTHPSSTWLTAFVAKVFCQARTFILIDPDHMCKSLQWLQKRQHHNGAFFDNGTLIHKEMTGGVQGDVSLTAFVLITMLECDDCNSPEKHAATQLGVRYLEEQMPTMKRPYTIALVAYALGLAKSDKANEANAKLKQIAIQDDARGEFYWNWDASEFGSGRKPWVYQNHPSAVAVETTSYALLTQLLHGDMQFSHQIVKWLNKQRTSKGAFVSTQDTVIALQALAEYNILAKFPEIDLVCNITSTASNRPKRSIVLKENNFFVLHEEEMPAAGKLFFDVTGKGLAKMAISLRYNVEQGPERTCKFELNATSEEFTEVIKPAVVKPEFDGQVNFLPVPVVRAIFSEDEQKNKFGYEVSNNVDANLNRHRVGDANVPGESQHIVKINICVKYLEPGKAGMSILDVGLFTGYHALTEDLNNLVQNPATKVSSFDFSERSVILYLEEVPSDKPMCLSFRSARSITVGKVQPTAVRVYDYYEPGKSCTTFYGPDKSSSMLKKICEGKQCFCLQGLCPSCIPFRHLGEIATEANRRAELLDMACDRHDYVWNGTLVSAHQNASLKYYTYKISDVLKEGTEKGDDLIDNTVTFIARDACACPVMTVGNVYIIMGEDGKPYETKTGELKFKYMIDKKTSIHHSRPLRHIRTKKDQLIQKTFNTMYLKFAINKEGCRH